MKIIYTGLESSGKTLFLADKLTELLKRNIRWKRKYKFHRLIYTNMALSEKYYNKYKDFIKYWINVNDVIGLSGCDIIWDEISSDFSALRNEPLGKEINRWLRQGAKQGVHIYATAQQFHDIHLNFRRTVKVAYSCGKWFGSNRGGKNLPPIKFLWGICGKRILKINPYNELQPETQGLPNILWIGKKLCSIFNTYQVIKGALEDRPLDHIVRSCPICKIKKVWHN